jgi:hypothetical protein
MRITILKLQDIRTNNYQIEEGNISSGHYQKN